MRDPENLHKYYEYVDDVPDVIKLSDIPPFTISDYDLNDEKEFKKYIEDIKRVVRGSYEYHTMINYLRTYLDMNKCSFYENVSNADSTKIHIEIHHEPLSLEVEMVAKEAMYHHYTMSVGLIPLAETVHELVHNKYLFVPSTKVYGNYKKFVQDYEAFMPPECITSLRKIEEMSETYEADEFNTILSKKFIYVDVSGAYKLPRLEDVSALIKSRISELMDNPSKPNELPKEEKRYYEPVIFEN